jgi:hypothetical protein
LAHGASASFSNSARPCSPHNDLKQYSSHQLLKGRLQAGRTSIEAALDGASRGSVLS